MDRNKQTIFKKKNKKGKNTYLLVFAHQMNDNEVLMRFKSKSFYKKDTLLKK